MGKLLNLGNLSFIMCNIWIKTLTLLAGSIQSHKTKVTGHTQYLVAVVIEH